MTIRLCIYREEGVENVLAVYPKIFKEGAISSIRLRNATVQKPVEFVLHGFEKGRPKAVYLQKGGKDRDYIEEGKGWAIYASDDVWLDEEMVRG
jgi:hypothetical protein